MDPFEDSYPNQSPYNYCLNNPVNLTDPTGGYVCGGGYSGPLWVDGNYDCPWAGRPRGIETERPVDPWFGFCSASFQKMFDDVVAWNRKTDDIQLQLAALENERLKLQAEFDAIMKGENETSQTASGSGGFHCCAPLDGPETINVMDPEDWVSMYKNGQFTRECHAAAAKMLANKGVEESGEMIQIVNLGENGRAGTPNKNVAAGIAAIDDALDNGKPIIVSADYKTECGKDMRDKMADHFLVVMGRTRNYDKGKLVSTEYRYYDSRASLVERGTQESNTLTLINNRLTGNFHYTYQGKKTYSTYIVTTIRKNK